METPTPSGPEPRPDQNSKPENGMTIHISFPDAMKDDPIAQEISGSYEYETPETDQQTAPSNSLSVESNVSQPPVTQRMRPVSSLAITGAMKESVSSERKERISSRIVSSAKLAVTGLLLAHTQLSVNLSERLVSKDRKQRRLRSNTARGAINYNLDHVHKIHERKEKAEKSQSIGDSRAERMFNKNARKISRKAGGTEALRRNLIESLQAERSAIKGEVLKPKSMFDAGDVEKTKGDIQRRAEARMKAARADAAKRRYDSMKPTAKDETGRATYRDRINADLDENNTFDAQKYRVKAERDLISSYLGKKLGINPYDIEGGEIDKETSRHVEQFTQLYYADELKPANIVHARQAIARQTEANIAAARAKATKAKTDFDPNVYRQIAHAQAASQHIARSFGIELGSVDISSPDAVDGIRNPMDRQRARMILAFDHKLMTKSDKDLVDEAATAQTISAIEARTIRGKITNLAGIENRRVVNQGEKADKAILPKAQQDLTLRFIANKLGFDVSTDPSEESDTSIAQLSDFKTRFGNSEAISAWREGLDRFIALNEDELDELVRSEKKNKKTTLSVSDVLEDKNQRNQQEKAA